MLMERVAGCWWNDWPDVRGTRGRMAWNTHPVEKFLQVQIHDDKMAVDDVCPGLGKCVMCALTRAEAEARRRECRVEDRL